jgi:hypothetical protein
MFKPRFQTESLHPVEHRYEERENSEVIEIEEPEGALPSMMVRPYG